MKQNPPCCQWGRYVMASLPCPISFHYYTPNISAHRNVPQNFPFRWRSDLSRSEGSHLKILLRLLNMLLSDQCFQFEVLLPQELMICAIMSSALKGTIPHSVCIAVNTLHSNHPTRSRINPISLNWLVHEGRVDAKVSK